MFPAFIQSTNRMGRQPTPAPFAAQGSRLDNIQGFVGGTLDSISRFVGNLRSRGTPTAAPPAAPVPVAVTASAVGGINVKTIIWVGVAALVGFFIFKRLK